MQSEEAQRLAISDLLAIAERAAVACSRLVRNHPFVDGNKRVAYAVLRMMLLSVDLDLQVADKAEAAEQVERLASRELSESDFAAWVHTVTV